MVKKRESGLVRGADGGEGGRGGRRRGGEGKGRWEDGGRARVFLVCLATVGVDRKQLKLTSLLLISCPHFHFSFSTPLPTSLFTTTPRFTRTLARTLLNLALPNVCPVRSFLLPPPPQVTPTSRTFPNSILNSNSTLSRPGNVESPGE